MMTEYLMLTDKVKDILHMVMVFGLSYAFVVGLVFLAEYLKEKYW